MTHHPRPFPFPLRPLGPQPTQFTTCSKCTKATVSGSSYCGEHKCSQTGCNKAASSSWGKCSDHTTKSVGVDDSEMGHIHYETGWTPHLGTHIHELPTSFWN